MKRFCLIVLSLLLTVAAVAQNRNEHLKVDWPSEYNWKVASSQEENGLQMIELIPGDEDPQIWSIIVTMMSMPGVRNVPMEVAMNTLLDQAKETAPSAKLTLIEKQDSVAHPWALFTIEAPEFVGRDQPESQLYHVIQGQSGLYTNFVAVRKPALSKEFIAQWSAIFKKTEILER